VTRPPRTRLSLPRQTPKRQVERLAC
jgi:hypothetical protein